MNSGRPYQAACFNTSRCLPARMSGTYARCTVGWPLPSTAMKRSRRARGLCRAGMANGRPSRSARSFGCARSGRDVPTMYHALGKQRGVAVSTGQSKTGLDLAKQLSPGRTRIRDRGPHNPKVAGSNPAPATNARKQLRGPFRTSRGGPPWRLRGRFLPDHPAQSVDEEDGKERTGTSPLKTEERTDQPPTQRTSRVDRSTGSGRCLRS